MLVPLERLKMKNQMTWPGCVMTPLKLGLLWNLRMKSGVVESGKEANLKTGLAKVVLTRPSVCSKSAIFREAWHIVNLQSCSCPLEANTTHQSFQMMYITLF